MRDIVKVPALRFFATIAATLMVMLMIVSVSTTVASADELDDRMAKAKAKQSQVKDQIEGLQSDLSETDKQLSDAYVKLREVEAELPVAEAALSIATQEFQKAQREADALAQKLEDAQAERDALQEQIAANDESMEEARSGIAEMARQAARGDLDMTSLDLIVGSQSTEEFVDRYTMNSTAMRTQQKSLDRLRVSQAVSRNAEVRLEAINDAIVELKKDADEQVVVAQQKEQEAASAKAAVQNLIIAQENATATIENRLVTVKQELASADQNSENLSNEIRQIAGLQEEQRKEEERKEKARKEAERKKKEEEDRKKKEEEKNNSNSGGSGSGGSGSGSGSGGSGSGGSGSGSGGSGSGGSGSGGSSSGWFSWPTAYRVVTSSYGWRLHPVLGYYRLHAGTDMRAYCGTPIYAARSGTVQWAKWNSGFGNQVLVNHGSISGDNVMTSYNHLTSFATRAGSKVSAGDLLGYAGNTGLSGACHLHFEVYINGSTIDPMTKMK